MAISDRMLKRNQIEEMCLAGESNGVDFKCEQYLFVKAADVNKAELLKDVLAMANAGRQDAGFILIGVEELPNKCGKVVGIDVADVIDDAMLHQFVNAKTNAAIPFASYVLSSGLTERECIQVIEIGPCHEIRPFYLRKGFGGLEAEKVYMRDGTSTVVASPTQVREMGEAAARGKARLVVELPDEVKVERDWSAVVVENAVVEDLDEVAVEAARKGFAEAHADRMTQAEILGWPVMTLLEKVRLAVDGRMTRAALLLLGKREASVKLSPYVAQITWSLGGQRAYEHFGPPFILTTTQVYRKIRNFNLSIVPKDSMLPVSISKYTEKVVLEPLHNCIAHQDYEKQQRIVVTEFDDRLEFVNGGSFVEGLPRDYVTGEKRPRIYRNRLLAEAMADLHMIDSMGFGIHDVYAAQRKRFLPLPDYELTSDSVLVRVFGQVVNEAYSRLLIANEDISLVDVFNLDLVQKHKKVSPEALARLRALKYVEGRGKQIRISSKIAALTAQKAEYIQLRATEDANLKRMILDYLAQFGSTTRREINNLIRGKMHAALSEKEKTAKISNLLTAMRKAKLIRCVGAKRGSVWVLFNSVEIKS